MELWDPWRHASEEGVRVFWKVLPHPFRGVYSMVQGRAHVSLHRGLTEVEARCTLAEELGHHATRGCLYPAAALLDPGLRVAYGVAEARAYRWAVAHLMPEEDVLALLRAGARPHELADMFQVTPEFVDYRLKTLSAASLPMALRSA